MANNATARVWNQDCISGIREHLEPESVHLTVTSIPFEELFTYSGKLEDVGNNGSTIDIRAGRFALNMRFVVDSLFWVTHPGCNVAIHIQQLLAYKNMHGFIGRRDFRGAMIDVFGAAGFHFAGEFAIQKDPQAIANRMNLHSLQFKTGYARNANMLAPVFNDYVLIFHKPGDAKFEPPVRPLKHKTNPGGWVATDEWIRDAHGIWTDILEIDVLDGARSAKESDQEKHVCLARGSLVLTYDGHKPIEDVEIGDRVLTHMGRWRPVTAKACMGKKPVVKVMAQGVADLRVTPDHKLWTRSGTGVGRWPGMAGGSSHPRSNAMSATPAWMRADATKASYLNLKLPPIEESPLTPKEWWIVGRWLSCGHLDAYGHLHISCGDHKLDAMVSELGERCGAITQRRTCTQVAINDRDGRLRGIIARCGRGAAGKFLPGEALSLDIEKSEALLSGYLSGDGHHVDSIGRWSASSVSRSLLLGMAMVAQRARGVVASVYAGREPGTTVIEGRTVNTQQDWILSVSPRNVSGMMLDDGAWKKVRHVNPAGEEEVWDISVAEDASFTAEGCIVSNCPLQLEVIRRLVRLYSNPIEIQPDVLVLDPFMGIGSTAWVALNAPSPITSQRAGAQRNVVGFELKESYHANAARNVERAHKLAKQAAKEKEPLLAGMK